MSAPGDELRRVRIINAPARLEWAVGRDVSLPATLIGAISNGDVDSVDLTTLAPPPLEAAQALRLRAAFTARPLSSSLPFSYQRVPSRVRAWIASHAGHRLRAKSHQWSRFPGWPLDLSADVVADWAASGGNAGDDAGGGAARGRPAPVLLTHDIDSPEGLRNLVNQFLPAAEAVGARTTNYVVPCGWSLDHGLLREVVARGHAIGVHGYDHANRTPFADDGERRRRLTDGRAALSAYQPRGYRAPSLLRTPALVTDLADYYAYDSSIPTSGGPFPVPNQGCATARPFFIGRTLEIPVSIVRDGSLRFLGFMPDDIGAMWRQAATDIAAARGIAVLLTHCEEHFSGTPAMLATYRHFLEFVTASPAFAWSTAEQIARDAA